MSIALLLSAAGWPAVLRHRTRLRPGPSLARAECRRSIRTVLFPLPHALLGLVTLNAITFLNPTYELVAPTSNLVQFIVGDFSPLLFNLALELLPIALCTIPVHSNSLVDDVK